MKSTNSSPITVVIRNLHRIITVIFFLLPFGWFPAGTVDLGGDSSRLHLFDPARFLEATAWWGFQQSGIGAITPNYYYVPYVSVLTFIMAFIRSPWLLSAALHGLKLSAAFYFMSRTVDLVVRESDPRQNDSAGWVSVAAGLAYVLSPYTTAGWTIALTTHDHVFIYPVVVYSLWSLFLTGKVRYAVASLAATVLFAINFSYTGAPSFLSFYPLAILYGMFVFRKHIRKNFSFRMVGAGVILSVLSHSFHLLPTASAVLTRDTTISQRIFNDVHYNLNYLYGNLQASKLSANFLHRPTSTSVTLAFGAVLIIVISALMFGRRMKSLSAAFAICLALLFLMTGDITDVGVWLYAALFRIPGFGIFRNFLGQWMQSFAFFSALSFGLAISALSGKWRGWSGLVLAISVSLIITASAWPFLSGQTLRTIELGGAKIEVAVNFEQAFGRMLEFAESVRNDGKFLSVPLTGCCYDVLTDENGRYYIGVSPLTMLGGRADFNGYAILNPFSESFLRSIADQSRTEDDLEILGLLGVRYIVHNRRDANYLPFDGYPYDYVKKYVPADQTGYRAWISSLGGTAISEDESFSVSELSEKDRYPTVYTPTALIRYEPHPDETPYDRAMAFVPRSSSEKKIAYIERGVTDLPEKLESPPIQFQRVNPVRYRVTIGTDAVSEPFVLVLSQLYAANWRLRAGPSFRWDTPVTSTYFDGSVIEYEKSESYLRDDLFDSGFRYQGPEFRHFRVNGYANAWLIDPDLSGSDPLSLTIHFQDQSYFAWGLVISVLAWITVGIGSIKHGISRVRNLV